MESLVSARSDLFSISQVAKSLDMSRDKLAGIIIGLRIKLKSDPTRPLAKMLDSHDIERIVDVSGHYVD